MNSAPTPEEPRFERVIGTARATAMVVGVIIGASIFIQPSEVTALVPSLAGVFAVWTVSGVLTLFGALVCAELAAAFPRSGGVYVFLKEAVSPAAGFLWGWAMFWTVHSAILAVVAVIAARHVDYFVPLGDVGVRFVAIGLILAISLLNYRGVRQGSALQTAFTVGKLAAIVAILALGFSLGADAHALAAATEAPAGGSVSFMGFLTAVSAGLFAYGGWHMVTYNAGETINPRRTIPRALVFGVLIVTVCYLALNAVYLYVLPLETVIHSKRVAADAADALGFGGGAFLSALVVFSAIGALIGIVLSGPRVYHAMALDGLAFRWLGRLHPRFATPHRAIILQALWSSVLVAIGSYRGLFLGVVYTEWLFFGAMACGLLLLRRRGVIERPASVLGNPLIPIVFALCAFAIAIPQVVENVGSGLGALGIGLVASGVPVYYLFLRGRAKPSA